MGSKLVYEAGQCSTEYKNKNMEKCKLTISIGIHVLLTTVETTPK